jgi:hypothetical protein
MTNHLKKIFHKNILFFLIFLIFLLIAIFANYVGFLSPDSRAYIDIAKSISNKFEITLNGKYHAVWPFGYPFLIAIFYKITNLTSYILASKIVNFFCLSLSFIFLIKIFKNKSIAILFIINPVVLKLYQYTWSENLFLLAVIGLILQLKLSYEKKLTFKRFFWLTFFIILGCSSRYIFAPFTFLIWICFYFCYDKKTSLKILPSFVIGGIFFIFYLFFNISKTTFATGMERIPAPESFFYLLVYFLRPIIEISFIIIINILIFYTLLNYKKNYHFLKKNFNGYFENITLSKKKLTLFLILIGLNYLFLSFILRLSSWFDKFDTRTLGYGLIFLFSGICVLIFKNKEKNNKIIYALIFSSIFSFLSSNNIFVIWKSLQSRSFINAENIISKNISGIKNKVVFSSNHGNSDILFIAGGSEYYGEDTIVEPWRIWPAKKIENLESFIFRIRKHANNDCVFDFSKFTKIEDLNQKLNIKIATNIEFMISKNPVKITYVNLMDQEVKDFIRKSYSPRTIVSCSDALEKNLIFK